MTAHHNQNRTDFRCNRCQQKGVFHCEHDTPYRDEYLGASTSKEVRNYIITTSGKEKNRNSAGKKETNGKTPIASPQAPEQNSKKKSCTIL